MADPRSTPRAAMRRAATRRTGDAASAAVEGAGSSDGGTRLPVPSA